MENIVSLLPLLGIALLFWVLVILPTRRRQKAAAELQAALQPGDEVMLTSGIFGVVRTVADDRLGLELAPGTVVQVARAAVASTTPAAPVVESED